MGVPPSLKITDPTGLLPATVAVSITDAPNADGFGDETKDVVVFVPNPPTSIFTTKASGGTPAGSMLFTSGNDRSLFQPVTKTLPDRSTAMGLPSPKYSVDELAPRNVEKSSDERSGLSLLTNAVEKPLMAVHTGSSSGRPGGPFPPTNTLPPGSSAIAPLNVCSPPGEPR